MFTVNENIASVLFLNRNAAENTDSNMHYVNLSGVTTIEKDLMLVNDLGTLVNEICVW